MRLLEHGAVVDQPECMEEQEELVTMLRKLDDPNGS